MKQAQFDVIKARLTQPGAYRQNADLAEADLASLLDGYEQLQARLDTQQAKLAESEVEKFNMMQEHDEDLRWLCLQIEGLGGTVKPRPKKPAACLQECTSCQKKGGVGA